MENKNTNFDILGLLEIEEHSKDIVYMNREEDIYEKQTIEQPNNNIDQLASFDIPKAVPIVNTESVKQEEYIQDILAELSSENIESQTIEIEKKGFFSKIFGGMIFLIKYLATSSVIFMLLLSITNYSAYIEIARSYLNPESLEINKNALLSSVNGIALIENKDTGSGEEIQIQTTLEKLSGVKNRTFHSMDKLINGTYDENLNMQIDITPYENRVIIPKIGKNIPLLEVKDKKVQNVKELEDTFMNELSKGIIRYPGSAKPGEYGNAFIFGHSSNFPWIKGEYNDVFALLDNIVFGDEVIVYYEQKKFVYKIKEKKVIKPGDISVLKRSNGKIEISLMTCWPVGTTLNRMIVIGELVN